MVEELPRRHEQRSSTSIVPDDRRLSPKRCQNRHRNDHRMTSISNRRRLSAHMPPSQRHRLLSMNPSPPNSLRCKNVFQTTIGVFKSAEGHLLSSQGQRRADIHAESHSRPGQCYNTSNELTLKTDRRRKTKQHRSLFPHRQVTHLISSRTF